MGKADTDDAADPLDAQIAPPLPVSVPGGMSGLWRRYRRLPRNVFAISLVSLLNDVSSEIVYPLLPFFLSNTLAFRREYSEVSKARPNPSPAY